MLAKMKRPNRLGAARSQILSIFATVTLLAGFAVSSMSSSKLLPTPAPAGSTAALSNLGDLPLAFVPNEGQTSDQVRFTTRASGGTIDFSAAGLSLSLPATSSETQDAKVQQVQMRFLASNLAASIEAGPALPGKASYYLGNDPSQWHTSLSTYESITYRELYPGVDVQYEGNAGSLKGTYTVAPGADPSAIHWRYDTSSVSLDAEGNLLIATNGTAKLTELAPVAWQLVGGQRVPVQVAYHLEDGNAGFKVGAYDPSLPLVIDPTLTYSTYFGTWARDTNSGIGLDAAGNIYVGGSSYGVDFQYGNIMIAKLSPDGHTVLYTVDFGGSRSEVASAMTVDPAGNLYITGFTNSINYPLLNPFQAAYRATVLTKFNTAGTMLYSTHFGGTGPDAATSIRVDGEGNMYLAGATNSTDFPTVNPIQGALRGNSDGFLSKLNAAGSALIFSTYLGGNNNDIIEGLTLDHVGDLYITGYTISSDYPTTPGAFQTTHVGLQDAFVSKVNASGSGLVWSTYLSGGNDAGYGIAVDTTGHAYVTGVTESQSFPVTPGSFQPYYHGSGDAFVTKFTPDGSALVYSSLLGGSGTFPQGEDIGTAIAVDGEGYAYVTGSTFSPDFPTLSAVQDHHGGLHDAFVTKFRPDGASVSYSTFLGGTYVLNGGDGDDVGEEILLDQQGNVVVGGTAQSGNFPTANPLMADLQGTADYFISRISDTNPTPTPTVTGTPPTATATPSVTMTPTSIPTFQPTATITPAACATSVAIQGNLGANDQVASSGLVYDEVASTCANPKNCPGVVQDTYIYDEYRFINTSGAARCITITIDGSDCGGPLGVTSAAYLGTFDLSNACANYLADTGDLSMHLTGPLTYSFNVPAGAQFAVIVEGESGKAWCEQYSLSVSGLAGCSTSTPTSTPATGSPTTGATATANVTGTAVTGTPTACAVTFSDVPADNPFHSFVQCLACRGVLSGYEDGTFRPGNEITRGQIAKVVSNAAGFDDDPGTQVYEDVDPDNTFYAWISRLSHRGYMGGYPCNQDPNEPCGGNNLPYFRPFANATRGQLAKIVANAAGLGSTPTGQFYVDVQEDHPFYTWIMRLTNLGVMSGYDCGGDGEPCDSQNRPYFRPFNNVTRGQASKIVANTFYPICQAPLRK
jgi:hypothetical protein